MAERDEEWGPWIEHDGKGCPVPVGTIVTVYIPARGELIAVAGCSDIAGGGHKAHGCENTEKSAWVCESPVFRRLTIQRYRIRKPRALRDLIKLAETVPSEMEDA